jgi:hypothetical protein
MSARGMRIYALSTGRSTLAADVTSLMAAVTWATHV